MNHITYTTDDKALQAGPFIEMARQVWPGSYEEARTRTALARTLNITARHDGQLVGCVRLLTDGCFFGTVTEILVLPAFQKQGVGTQLMRLAQQATPTRLFFGAQPEAVGFYEKLGYKKSLQSFEIPKPNK